MKAHPGSPTMATSTELLQPASSKTGNGWIHRCGLALYKCEAGTKMSRKTGSCPQSIWVAEARPKLNPSQSGQEYTEKLLSICRRRNKAGAGIQHASTGMYARNATHPTTPVEKAYAPPSVKPTQASLPSALVIPFIRKVQGKGSRAERIPISSSTASEVIHALAPHLLHQYVCKGITQTEHKDAGFVWREASHPWPLLSTGGEYKWWQWPTTMLLTLQYSRLHEYCSSLQGPWWPKWT